MFINLVQMQGGVNVKISSKCRYGTRAMIEIARRFGSEPVKRRAIVEKQGISDSYLENILILLKNAGLIDAVRGARGGYALSRSPGAITMLDVFSALEGQHAPVACLDSPSACERTTTCATRSVWSRVHEAMNDVLRKVTLEDLVDNEGNSESAQFCI